MNDAPPPPSRNIHAFTATSLDQIRGLRDAWDGLAVAAGNPYAAPAWVLASWRHAAPEDALLRLLVVTDADGLVGVAPFAVDRGRGRIVRHSLIGAAAAARSPLVVRPGMETVAARYFAELLSGGEPAARVVVLAGLPDDALSRSFLDELVRVFPRLHVRQDVVLPSPFVRLDSPSFDAWYASKSRNFRQQTRRRRRQLEALGGSFRVRTRSDELPDALAALAALHYSRWRWRGGSAVLTAATEAAVLEAARELAPSDRFRLWSLEIDGTTIAAMAFFGAGRELAWWIGGFDEAWSTYQPGIATMLIAIEDAFAKGNTRLALGAGGQEMKQRFADEAETLSWLTITTSPRYWIAGWIQQRFGLRIRLAVSSRLSESHRRKLRKLARKLYELRSRSN
jgi:CelD/BcsL family acetyltransferase involved in cellulose biosynthesis